MQLMSLLGIHGPDLVVESLGGLGIPRYEHVFMALNDHADESPNGGSHWGLLVYRRATASFHL